MTVPEGVFPGETIHVNFTDEKNETTTLAAVVPPKAFPGMQFFVELPTIIYHDAPYNESTTKDDLLLIEEQTNTCTQANQQNLVAYEALPLDLPTSTPPSTKIV